MRRGSRERVPLAFVSLLCELLAIVVKFMLRSPKYFSVSRPLKTSPALSATTQSSGQRWSCSAAQPRRAAPAGRPSPARGVATTYRTPVPSLLRVEVQRRAPLCVDFERIRERLIVGSIDLSINFDDDDRIYRI